MWNREQAHEGRSEGFEDDGRETSAVRAAASGQGGDARGGFLDHLRAKVQKLGGERVRARAMKLEQKTVVQVLCRVAVGRGGRVRRVPQQRFPQLAHSLHAHFPVRILCGVFQGDWLVGGKMRGVRC